MSKPLSIPPPHKPAPEKPANGTSLPLVSVVIPTYNRGVFLKTAIASALAQERADELFDLEIIVVDDCSPDDMSHIAGAFPGVQYVRLPENRGASGARNAGIKLAKGKYVALLDDDDEFLTHKLMVQVPILETNPDVGVVYGQSVVTGSDAPLLLWPEWAPSGHVFEEFLTRTDDFLHPPTWLVRRELFEAAGWFDEQHRTMEHYDMALRLAALTQWRFLSGGPVARGRFSQKGKWYSNIVNGTNAQRLPRIVEGALMRLPSTPDADRIRRKARAAICATVMGQNWWIGGGLTPAKTYLLASLQTTPELLQEAAVVQWVNRIAGALADSSQQPIHAVKDFWNEIMAVTALTSPADTVSLRRVLGEMLAAVAIEMRRGSPRRAWVVAASAMFHDPTLWIHPSRPLRLYRILSSHPTSKTAAHPASRS